VTFCTQAGNSSVSDIIRSMCNAALNTYSVMSTAQPVI